MILWLDEQLSPTLADWIARQFKVAVRPVRELGLKGSSDSEIYFAARRANAVVMTKDQDFVRLLGAHGPPPKVIWVTCGNTSNDRMKQILAASLPGALVLLDRGESLIELRDAH
jgi:predicted nuclease of predicted toxin-antitoxin system